MARAWSFAMIVLGSAHTRRGAGPARGIGEPQRRHVECGSAASADPDAAEWAAQLTQDERTWWVLYGVHAPNGPPRRGSEYLVNAWGISGRKAKKLLRASS